MYFGFHTWIHIGQLTTNIPRAKMYSKSKQVDPAIITALSLDPATSYVVSHGTSSFSRTAKIVSREGGENGTERIFFLKTAQGDEAAIMFEGR